MGIEFVKCSNIDDTVLLSDNTVEIYNRWLLYMTKGYNNTSNAFEGAGRSIISNLQVYLQELIFIY
jgi:hypothetical protein